MLSNKRKIIFLCLFILVIFTRFYRLNWDSGFSFHPDENNMALSVLQMDFPHLNPNFFAYGQFPLYLTFFTTPKHDFTTITLTLRFWSAFFSSLSIMIFYFIGLKIFNKHQNSLIFCLFLIFTPGLIQLAHFGTTESILFFVFSLNLLLSFFIYDQPQPKKYLILAGIFSGIGLSSKISALILTCPIFLSLLFLFLKHRSFKKIFFQVLFFIFSTVLIGILLSPYNLINFRQFIDSIRYEIGVANGSISVFYTRQFIGTIPYIFQIQKIFPYTNGLFVFIFGIIGLSFILKSWIKNLLCRQAGHKLNPYLLITLFSSLVYFIYQGQLFTKWTRFMAPIFFVLPLLSVLFINQLKNKLIRYFLILLSIFPGIFFMKTYFSIDTRIQATEWINQNISPDKYVLSESGNVVNLPLSDSKIDVNNFDFYTLDENENYNHNLNQQIQKSDYVFVPSRRVFANQNNASFPYSQQYYQHLFSGDLGFNLIKTFSNPNSLFLNSEAAEETWSVFDNPTIRIYQRQSYDQK